MFIIVVKSYIIVVLLYISIFAKISKMQETRRLTKNTSDVKRCQWQYSTNALKDEPNVI